MQLDAYQRGCVTIILTGGAVFTLWGLCWLFSIPPSEVVPMNIALVSISAGLRRPVSRLEGLPLAAYGGLVWLGAPEPGPRLQRWLRIPRSLSITIIYLLFIGLLIFASTRVFPLVRDQIWAIATEVRNHWVSPSELMALIPDWAKEYVPAWLPQMVADFGKDKVGDVAGYLTGFVGTMSGVVTTAVSMTFKTAFLLILVFLLTLTEGLISSYVTLPIKDESKAVRVKKAIDGTMLELGQWANAQVLIGVFYGATFGTLLPIIGIPYGFTIGLVGFLLEAVVPMVGALFTLLFLALPVAMVHGGLGGIIAVLIVWIIIFALEWHVIYPMIMGRALKFDAFITLWAMWIGFFPLGILGSVLVLPCMVIGANALKFAFPHMMKDEDKTSPAHHQMITLAFKWIKNRIQTMRDNHKPQDDDQTTPPPSA